MEINFGELKGLVEGLTKVVDRLDKTLYGNGHPGVLDRQIRLEEQLETLNETMLDNKKAIVEATNEFRKAISEQKELMAEQSKVIEQQTNLITQVNTQLQDHIKSGDKLFISSLKNFLLNKNNFMLISILILIIHAVLEALNVGLVEVQHFILKTLGIE